MQTDGLQPLRVSEAQGAAMTFWQLLMVANLLITVWAGLVLLRYRRAIRRCAAEAQAGWSATAAAV